MTVLFLGVVGDMRPEIDSHNRTPSIIAMITDAETSISRTVWYTYKPESGKQSGKQSGKPD